MLSRSRSFAGALLITLCFVPVQLNAENEGDRARFSPERQVDAAQAPSAPSARAVRACNDARREYGEVVKTTPLRPGWWEIVMRFRDGSFACTVDDAGRVDDLTKIES